MKKVLIVDDSDLIRQTIKRFLPAYGDLEIVGECEDGNQVIEFLKHTAVDAILLDYHMPIMNGLETAREVRAAYKEIQIILHTSDEIAANDIVDVDGVFIKPAKLADIAKAIESDIISSR